MPVVVLALWSSQAARSIDVAFYPQSEEDFHRRVTESAEKTMKKRVPQDPPPISFG